MSKRLEGGLLGARPNWAIGNNAGLWTPEQQLARRRVSTWPLGGDPSFASVSLLLSMNGANNSTTFTDRSSNALTVTANGNAKISTAQSKFDGTSAVLDGTGDYLMTPHNAVFSIESTDFALEAWIYRSASNAIHNILNKRIGIPASGWGWRINSNNTLQFFHPGGSSITSTGTVPSGAWVHVAATRSGNTVRQFVGGTLDATTATFSNGTSNTTELRVGVDEAGGDGFNGYIDDLRITKGVARYTSSFTPPDRPFPANL
jgi:hypothetical protein